MFEPVTENTKEDKTMSKFKVGDKVRVREDFKRWVVYFSKTYDVVATEMAKLAGQIVTIEFVRFDGMYFVKECGEWWADDMFESEPISSTSKSKENKDMKNMRKVCYEIVDYKYNTETGETYIKWDDKSETRVKPEAGTEPDQFVGFVTAYAKKAAGNTGRINSFFTQWAIKKPKLDAEEKAKKKAAKAEAKRIAEKRKAKKEKWLVRKAALRIKREYEAAQLAHEEYGVPVDFQEEK
jgi:hypothetical protein